MRILFLITRQFQQLMLLKQMSAEGLDRSELAKKASIPPFALGKYQAQCRKFTLADLRQAVEDCVDTEEQVKTGRMGDQLGVELLIIKSPCFFSYSKASAFTASASAFRAAFAAS